jgi:hypothetical protein
MMTETDIFDYLQTTALEPHDDYTSEIAYKDQKIIWNRLKEQENKINKYKQVIDKIKEYLTSYESINTIQECETPENNIGLDEKTFVEMVNRHMKLHDKILELLEEIE